MTGITWTKIEEIPDHFKDGREVLLHYDLSDLPASHPRVVVGFWDKTLKGWVWQDRSPRAYFTCHQPNYFAEINAPS